ncbi:carboxylesterase 15-like [Phragmites australis]|uniref:carboxylesterase 15-like n=1 Tax=Phragmites australis TaxID=29695 RepID=UPI002D793B73|nr:carboxylesterase 15-like [Phragmites australis]
MGIHGPRPPRRRGLRSFGVALPSTHRGLSSPLDNSLLWLRELRKEEARDGSDPWLAEATDSGRVFMTSDSASGNIALHLAVRFSSAAEHADLAPDSVHDCPTDALLRRRILNDRYWRLSLPEGATADHPVANPFGTGAPTLDAVAFASTLVVVGSRSKDKGGPP